MSGQPIRTSFLQEEGGITTTRWSRFRCRWLLLQQGNFAINNRGNGIKSGLQQKTYGFLNGALNGGFVGNNIQLVNGPSISDGICIAHCMVSHSNLYSYNLINISDPLFRMIDMGWTLLILQGLQTSIILYHQLDQWRILRIWIQLVCSRYPKPTPLWHLIIRICTMHNRLYIWSQSVNQKRWTSNLHFHQGKISYNLIDNNNFSNNLISFNNSFFHINVNKSPIKATRFISRSEKTVGIWCPKLSINRESSRKSL